MPNTDWWNLPEADFVNLHFGYVENSGEKL
jgi:hypothetical protein